MIIDPFLNWLYLFWSTHFPFFVTYLSLARGLRQAVLLCHCKYVSMINIIGTDTHCYLYISKPTYFARFGQYIELQFIESACYFGIFRNNS